MMCHSGLNVQSNGVNIHPRSQMQSHGPGDITNYLANSVTGKPTGAYHAAIIPELDL